MLRLNNESNQTIVWPWRCTQQWSLICQCCHSFASYAFMMENSISMMLLWPRDCSFFIRSLLNCACLDCLWLQLLQASWWPVNYCSCSSYFSVAAVEDWFSISHLSAILIACGSISVSLIRSSLAPRNGTLCYFFWLLGFLISDFVYWRWCNLYW